MHDYYNNPALFGLRCFFVFPVIKKSDFSGPVLTMGQPILGEMIAFVCVSHTY